MMLARAVCVEVLSRKEKHCDCSVGGLADISGDVLVHELARLLVRNMLQQTREARTR